MDEPIKLVADESDVIKALDNIEKKFKETGEAAKASESATQASIQGTAAALGASNKVLEEYIANEKRLSDTAKDRIAKFNESKAAMAKYRQEQEALRRETDQGVKKNFEYAKSISQTAKASKDQAKAATDAGQASGGFGRLLGAIPFGRIIIALGSVITFLSKFQEGMDFVSKVTSSVSAVLNVLVERLVLAGKSFAAFFSGNYLEAAKNAKAATDDFAGAIVNAATKAYDLEGRVQALRDAQLEASVATARLAAASEKQQAIAQQQSKTFDERIQALRNAIALEDEVAKRRIQFAEIDAQIAREQFEISAKGVSDKEVLIQKEIALIDTRNEADRKRIELIGQLNEVEKARTEFISKNLETVDRALEKLRGNLESDPIEQALVDVRQKYEGLTQLAIEAIEALREVEKLRPLSDDEIKKRQELQNAQADITEAAADAEIAALLDSVRQINEIEDKKQKALKAAREKQNEDARKALKDALDLQNQQIDITAAEFDNLIATLKAKGVSEAEIKEAQNEFDRRIKAERIEAEIEYQKALLSLVGNGNEADIIRARIQELGVLLEGLEIPEPKAKGKPKSIYDLLGIKFDDPEQQQAFENAVATIIESLGQITEARVQEAEAAVEAANSKVEAAEDALAKEEELAKEGLANNSDLRRKELEEAKKQRDIALKEESKAKREQLALDSLVQLSGLITSSVNIFSSLSKIPFVGIPLAIATIGLMFAAFAKVKADALKATAPAKLRKGAKIEGRTHEQGGEIRELEAGEQVVGAQEAAGQDAFFDNLRRGKYRGKNLAALAGGKSDDDYAVVHSASRAEAITRRRAEVDDKTKYEALMRVYQQGASDIVEAIRSKPDIYPWKNGYKEVHRSGSTTNRTTVLPAEE